MRDENKIKHDIMANIHVYGDLCPNAKSFIHLGVTSNFINDNYEINEKEKIRTPKYYH